MNEQELRDELHRQFGRPVCTILGTVKQVDENQRTCTIEDDGLDMPGVRLQCITGGNMGIVLIPKQNTQALILKIENDGWTLVQCAECEKILIDCDTIQLNGGENDGLINIRDLVQKLNAVETLVNNILSTLNGITITLAPSGTVPFAPIFAALSPLQTTQQSDIEDTKVKH